MKNYYYNMAHKQRIATFPSLLEVLVGIVTACAVYSLMALYTLIFTP